MHSLEPGELEHGHCPYWSDHKLITKYNDEVNTINKVIRNKRILLENTKIIRDDENHLYNVLLHSIQIDNKGQLIENVDFDSKSWPLYSTKGRYA